MKRITTEEARRMLESSPVGAVTVLDVRQPGEYQQFHLPGALLIPLPKLLERVGEVPENGPVLVYCRSGGRSAAAATLLENQGRADVLSMDGGTLAWNSQMAWGPVRSGLEQMDQVRSPGQLLRAAYGMESFLQRFYLHMRDEAAGPEEAATFDRLAGFEEGHKNSLYARYVRSAGSEALPRVAFEAEAEASVGEGGVDPEAFVAAHGPALATPVDVVSMGMMFEAQALDFYMRASRMAELVPVADLCVALAAEEQAHLRVLAGVMDQLTR